MTLGQHPESAPISADAKAIDCMKLWYPDGSASLRIRNSAIRELRAAVTSENIEVCGILLASISEEGVCVERCEGLKVFSDLKPAAPERVERALGNVITARQQDSLMGALTPIGVFRTTSLGAPPVMTESDYRIARRYLRAAGSLFVVIQPSPQVPWSATLFTWRDRGPSKSIAPTMTFPWDEHVLQMETAYSVAQNSRFGSLPAGISLPTAELPVRQSTGRLRNVVMIIVAVAVTVGIGSLAYRVFQPRNKVTVSESSTSADLALKVTRNGQDFEISWNQSPTLIQHALYGFLTILDNEYARVKQLNPDQLRRGHILYTPVSKEPKFSLELTLDDQRTASDSVQVLGAGLGPATTLLASDPVSSIHSARFGNSGTQVEPGHAISTQSSPRAVSGLMTGTLVPPQRLDKKPPEIIEVSSSSVPREQLNSPPNPTSDLGLLARTVPPSVASPTAPSPSLRWPEVVRTEDELGTKAGQPVRLVEPVHADLPKILQQPATLPDVRESHMAGLTSGVQVVRQVRPKAPPQIQGMLANQEIDILVTIDVNGRVVRSKVASKSGTLNGLFVPSALEAAQQWLFKPAQRGAENVSSDYLIKFVFAPEGAAR